MFFKDHVRLDNSMSSAINQSVSMLMTPVLPTFENGK